MINSRFIGRGFGFPMRVNATGGIAMVTDHQELEESMRLILGTAIGERPMRPLFGCRVHDRLFDSINAMTFALVAQDVQDAIAMWDPRVDVEDVIVTRHPDNESALLIEIRYTPRAFYDPRTLVFPFYTIPESEEEE
jgi:phage baseplate assembly protein W